MIYKEEQDGSNTNRLRLDERWHQRERRLARRGTDASMLSVSDAPETDADNEGA